jgi:hypothetical protein
MIYAHDRSGRPVLGCRPLVAVLLLAIGATSRADDRPPATFFRGINLNGPPVVIDGHPWDGGDAKSLTCAGQPHDDQAIALNPGAERARATMIRSSIRGDEISVTIKNVPNGTYNVFLYVWEEDSTASYGISANGREVVARYDSLSAGHWEKLGPWVVAVSDGTITLSSSGGKANFSGVEIWRGDGPIPPPHHVDEPEAVASGGAVSPEGIEFFEKRVRPILAERCYACHSAGAKKLRGGLLLDTRAGLLEGGASGPVVVPGQPDQSILISAVRYDDPTLQMPPKQRLSEAEIAALVGWVKLGAPDPRGPGPTASAPRKPIDLAEARRFWSFRPVADPPLPQVVDATWAHTTIDRFVLAGLEAKGMRPAQHADRRTLIRRATFDLTGLPPTPEEVNAFLADDAPDAFAKVVDLLLASPHYGERWGRHWLDLVRYADTSGCAADFPVPSAYLYRNYVIDALNADKPYDQFVRAQVAGDLLPHTSQGQKYEQIIATGYLAIGRRFGSLPDEFHLTLEDTIDVVGKTILGLSISCARCHDHKFDPITQRDYYALYGIFNSARYAYPGTELPAEPKDFVPLVTDEEQTRVVEPYERELQRLRADVARADRTRDLVKKGRKETTDGRTLPSLEEAKASCEAATQRLADHIAHRPDYRSAFAVTEGTPADARVQPKGDPRHLGPFVPRGFLGVLGGQRLAPGETGSGRLPLAGWLTDPGNPLTARVMVNRIWQYHFGQGLVRSPNDFGARGSPPTHPELLDHLATQFVRSGWSLKAMHRLIMLSSAYQMACDHDPRCLEVDPKNERLWTFNRRRLDAEELRDAMLAVGGGLDRTPGGPHPFPREPYHFTQHQPFFAVYPTDRRSVYLMQQRLKKHPFLEAFDGADPNATTAQRPFNITPIQALVFMNDPFVHDQAAHFADRLAREAPDQTGRIDLAYRRAFSRRPTERELGLCAAHLGACREALALGEIPSDERDRAAWASLLRAILASNEFSFVD